MSKFPVAVLFVLLPCSDIAFSQESAGESVSREFYLAYMRAAAEQGWNNLEADRKRWRENMDPDNVFGYAPPHNEVYLAALCANLFEATGERSFLRRARALLVHFGEFKKAYPADYASTRAEYHAGVPAIGNIFAFQKYCHAFGILKKNGALPPADRAVIEQNIAESADFLTGFQEWGPMNRAMLRAEGVLYAARVLPNHKHVPAWRMMGEAIARDNWGQWEIEDAPGYSAIWLYSLLGYASDVRSDESLYDTPVMRYYFSYFLALMSPAGLVPDFGDANWGHSWPRMIPFFEKGAAATGDGRLRWAAAQYVRTFLSPVPERKSMFAALALSDAYRWANFDLEGVRPTGGSQEVLEDIVGKKIVFRDGWQRNSSYLLLNYRDEGDGGWLFREYLRTTIPVEEEKMHHGHSDENSIVLLMHNGSVLLHDGGYRDYMPSGPMGAYRADYFHNRVVVRDGKIALGQREGEFRYASPGRSAVPGQTMLEFFRNSGAYQNVIARKIDFLTLKHFDMSRTRLIHERLGYEADRIINYVKELDWFVVFDVVRFTEPGYLTMANLWHTRQILEQGKNWYVTAYDSLRNRAVGGQSRLTVLFPQQKHLEQGTATMQRYYQNEKVVYQMIGRHGYRNDLQSFVTVLIPHDRGSQAADLVTAVKMLPVDAGDGAVGVEIRRDGKRYLVCAKLDMESELVRDWRRPMYTYDAGKVRYGEYETDANHLFAVESETEIQYAMVGAVRIKRGDRVLHEQPQARFGLNFDGSPDLPGAGKLRYWQDTVKK